VIVVWHVKFANRALRDLNHIYAHIEAVSSAQAAQWFARLEQAIFSLENLRQLLHGRKPYVYRVIYEVNQAATTVHVLHIRGPRRDRIKR